MEELSHPSPDPGSITQKMGISLCEDGDNEKKMDYLMNLYSNRLLISGGHSSVFCSNIFKESF